MSNVFVVPESAGSKPENRFHFTIKGTEYDVPKMEFLTGSQAEAIAGVNTGNMDIAAISAAWRVFDAEGDRVAQAVRGLEITQLSALLEAWAESSTVTPGESEPSES